MQQFQFDLMNYQLRQRDMLEAAKHERLVRVVLAGKRGFRPVVAGAGRLLVAAGLFLLRSVDASHDQPAIRVQGVAR